MMSGDNPCNVCDVIHDGSLDDCEGCIFEHMTWKAKDECHNDMCMCHYDLGCLLSLDNVCRASDVFNRPVFVMDD